MMRHYFYSHQGAAEAFPGEARAEIEHAIETCHPLIERESATSIRDHLVRSLGQNGWPDEFQVEPPSKITIASLKDDVGLCMQTGDSMSRMYADLLKLKSSTWKMPSRLARLFCQPRRPHVTLVTTLQMPTG